MPSKADLGGKLILIYLKWAQVITGYQTPLLENPTRTTPQLEREQWLTSLCEYLKLADLNIWIREIQGPSFRRQNDYILMDHVNAFSPLNIQRINRCRLYLKVETLADVCNAQGTQLKLPLLLCHPSGRQITSALWPRQERPGAQARKIWRKFLRQFCHPRTSILLQSLGPWRKLPHPNNWNAVYDLSLIHI